MKQSKFFSKNKKHFSCNWVKIKFLKTLILAKFELIIKLICRFKEIVKFIKIILVVCKKCYNFVAIFLLWQMDFYPLKISK